MEFKLIIKMKKTDNIKLNSVAFSKNNGLYEGEIE